MSWSIWKYAWENRKDTVTNCEAYYTDLSPTEVNEKNLIDFNKLDELNSWNK